MNCRKFEAAYTKMELLCVLGILALLGTLAAPLMRDIIPGRELDAAAHRMAMEMRRMQQTAITSGRTIIMKFRYYGNDYWIYDYRGETSRGIKLPEGVFYRSNNFPLQYGQRTLEFKRTGAPNRGGTVGLESTTGEVRYVIVTPATGRVRVSRDPPEHW